MTSRVCWILLSPLFCYAQSNVLSVAPVDRVTAKAGGVAEARVTPQLRSGYHTQSNAPTDEYAIPFLVTWKPAPLESPEVVYPKPKMEKYRYTEAAVPIFSGDFVVVTRFKVPSNTPPGPVKITGKVRYQACTDTTGVCLPPATIEVPVGVDVVK